VELPRLYYHSGVLTTHKDGQKTFLEKAEHLGIKHSLIAKDSEGMDKDFQLYGNSIKPSSTLRVGDLIKELTII
jgi:hypothetical protein